VTARELFGSIAPPLLLIFAVLGSILTGLATPTEAAGVGAMGAFVLALIKGSLDRGQFMDMGRATTRTTAMVFFILIGASLFSLVFRGFGGDALVQGIFTAMPGGVVGSTLSKSPLW
jgi:TRAP-type mannitol/chloroaromatic compound transport system permease large subunit